MASIYTFYQVAEAGQVYLGVVPQLYSGQTATGVYRTAPDHNAPSTTLPVVGTTATIDVYAEVQAGTTSTEPVAPGSGQLIPTGGSTGQVLTKNSGTDFDTAWAAAASGSDAYAQTTIGGSTSSSSYSATLSAPSNATPSATITVPASGKLKITVSINASVTAGQTLTGSFILSGATTLAAADGNGGAPLVLGGPALTSFSVTRVWVVTGLATGSTTVQLAWKTSTGTVAISAQTLLVETLS